MTKRLLILVELVVLAILIYWHFKLGLVRYFDADEYAHLHWGYSLSIGERPYTDFFYLFPPFFLYPIAAMFKLFGRTAVVILNARMLMFAVYLLVSAVLFLLVKKIRGVSVALLTLVVFAFMPLPFDKTIEIRPDMIAVFFSLLGMYLFIKGEEGRYFFLSGLCFAAGLGFVPKSIFFLVPVGIVFLISNLGNLSHLRRNAKKNALRFFLGFVSVGLILPALLFSYGNFSLGFYSMTKMASDVTRVLGVKFYMRPDIFFYPNDTYYGFGGWSVPLVTNLLIYFLAGIWGIHKLFTLGTSTTGGVRASQAQLATPGVSLPLGEFLLAGSFWANLAAFVYFYPLKHAQYLLPVAPFAAFLAADLWETAINRLFKSFKLLKTGLTIILLLFFAVVGMQMNSKKETWVNKPTFDKINFLLQSIPAGSPVYDLTGESIFFPNGYYFCCLPYGQYEEAVYFKIPDIAADLKRRNTQYVHLGYLSRLNEIPVPHARYIMDNFVPIVPDNALLKRKAD